MATAFQFTRKARTPQLIAVLTACYIILFLAFFALDAAWWMVVILALPTLPALWDLWRDTLSGLSLFDDHLDWRSAQHSNSLKFSQIDHARFDTRWDLSVRVSFILRSGRKIRLPPPVLPPHRQFETELQARGIRTERHHFRVF